MPNALRTRLEKINAILATGVTSTTSDGQSTSFDLKELRKEKRLLEEKLGITARRRRVFGFNMGSR